MESSPLLPKGSTSRSTWQELLDLSQMAFQVSLATLARQALTSIDSIFLGHLGVQELAAAALAQVWTCAPLMAVWASASALCTLCGQAWGAGNRELMGVWLQFGLLMTTLLSIPVFIWYWCIEYVLEFSTDDQRVQQLAAQFARVTSFAILPALIYGCLRQYFQAMGILMPTTIVNICSIFLAVGGNRVFIHGIAGWKGLGFVGSPLSTVVAAWFQPCMLFAYCVLYKKHHRRGWAGWSRKALTPCRFKIFAMVAGPIAGNSFVTNLANTLVSLVAAKLGPETIAANAVISGLWGLLWGLFWGYGCATQVRVANCLGAGDPKRAKMIAMIGLACTGVVVSILAAVTSMLDVDIIAIYTNDPGLLQKSKGVLPIFIAAYVLESIEMLCSGVLTGMRRVKIIFWTSTIATWCINLPVAYIGAVTLGYGFPALWIGILAMEIVKLSSYAFVLHRVDWDDMAQRAVAAMAHAPEASETSATASALCESQTPAEVETCSVQYITDLVGSNPTGYLASMPLSRTPPCTSMYARDQRLTKLQRRCVSHESPLLGR